MRVLFSQLNTFALIIHSAETSREIIKSPVQSENTHPKPGAPCHGRCHPAPCGSNYFQLFAVFWIGRNLCDTCKLLVYRAQRLHYFSLLISTRSRTSDLLHKRCAELAFCAFWVSGHMTRTNRAPEEDGHFGTLTKGKAPATLRRETSTRQTVRHFGEANGNGTVWRCLDGGPVSQVNTTSGGCDGETNLGKDRIPIFI